MAEEKKSGSWLVPIIVAVAVAFVVRSFFIAPYVVEGASMEPSLHDRDRILVNKTASWIGEYERGDIVIIEGENDRHYIKRVIGLPGESLEMQDGSLQVDGTEIDEPYILEMMEYTESLEPVTLEEDEFFVMGDNRNNSLDSRNGLGMIDEEHIVGRSAVVFFPFTDVRFTN
ncbi:signal peptidase I [Alkalicoccus urumqiensis]|uniref:Signal peptidase I n=1 Tax=Alkalicoccus urumqiensis TaxID=1548213 RepID=A0A2P6MLK6_ALKUR|nr:signal peptidase I [Alkalicoccus urumqiensis]PRO67166.1 signal peptidase I [Alkalicoccus urumqiensis]